MLPWLLDCVSFNLYCNLPLIILTITAWGRLYGDQNVTKNHPVVYDGDVKYDEAEIHRSAIMQAFRVSKKKNIKKKGRLAAILDVLV